MNVVSYDMAGCVCFSVTLVKWHGLKQAEDSDSVCGTWKRALDMLYNLDNDRQNRGDFINFYLEITVSQQFLVLIDSFFFDTTILAFENTRY